MTPSGFRSASGDVGWLLARGLLLPQLVGAVAEGLRFLQERLLLGGILLEVRLEPKQETLERERLDEVGLD